MKTYLKESDILLLLPELAPVAAGWLDQSDSRIYQQQNAFYLESELTGSKPLAFQFEAELNFWQGQLKQFGKKDVPLLKALGITGAHPPKHIYDLTAGMLKDSILCLAAGFKVTACERNPIVYSFIQLNLKNAAYLPDLHYQFGHCVDYLADYADQYLYFDPMFEIANKSAYSKKNMQVFKGLVGADADAQDVLSQLLASGAKRVVVKRADKAPVMAGQLHHQIKSKTLRFDVYLS
jgi:16S rRNA (guanine1516-N2)-methyltransferase